MNNLKLKPGQDRYHQLLNDLSEYSDNRSFQHYSRIELLDALRRLKQECVDLHCQHQSYRSKVGATLAVAVKQILEL